MASAHKISTSQKRLHELMSVMNIKQKDIVDKTGLNKSTISNYCNGNRVPNQKNIAIISDAFDISPAWLMGYDVGMKRSKEESKDYVVTLEEQKILVELQAIDPRDRELILSTLAIAYQNALDRKKEDSAS